MKVGIIGSGLSGSMIAGLLSQIPDLEIFVFEKRPDPRIDVSLLYDYVKSPFGSSISAARRSINLALSYRGMMALRELNMLDEVMKNAIPMPGRVIHSRNGETVMQAYGKSTEAIYSVGRQELNHKLLDKLDSLSHVSMNFNHTLTDINPHNGTCMFLDEGGNRISYTFDFIIGADGAYSAVRDRLLHKGRISFSRSFISHGYKELSIPPKISIDGKIVEYALKDYGGLHIWPRGKFMMIALPNPDFSFTATLFAPYTGPDGFDTIEAIEKGTGHVNEYFKRHFPDLVEYMPNLEQDFHNNPVGSLVTVRVDPWNLGRVVLIGDAAHAVVPFYGQGMNAAFEDCHMLYNMLRSASVKSSLTSKVCEEVIKEFAKARKPATDCLADLCVEHYNDMASNTTSTLYLMRKKFDALVAYLLPDLFIPLYSLIAFSKVPYHEALLRAKRQDKALTTAIMTGVTTIGFGLALSCGYLLAPRVASYYNVVWRSKFN